MTWRQHRLALAGVLVVLGGLGLFMLFNGLAMHHAYTSLGLDTCGNLSSPSCQSQLTDLPAGLRRVGPTTCRTF